MMEQFRVTLAIMAATDTRGGSRGAHGRRRELTAEEIDALAEFGWRLPDTRGTLKACRFAVLKPWRWILRNGSGSADLASAESS